MLLVDFIQYLCSKKKDFIQYMAFRLFEAASVAQMKTVLSRLMKWLRSTLLILDIQPTITNVVIRKKKANKFSRD